MIQDSSSVSQGRGRRTGCFVAVVGGIPLLIGIVLIVTSFVTRSQASLSSYVQDHGVRRTAVIEHVNNIEHRSSRSSGHHRSTSVSFTAEVLVRLAAPVGGHAQTTVHVPDFESDVPGQSLTVLVDPKDPGYAELPGSPSTSPIVPTILLILGAVFVVIAVVAGVAITRAARRARPPAAAPPRQWQRS